MAARDYRKTNQALATALMALLDQSPNAIDLILFKALPGTEEVVAEGADVVGTMESRERRIDYADPDNTKGLIIPDESIILGMSDDGESPVPGEEPIIMLVKTPDIPKQSVIWYEEYINETDTEEHYFYLLKSEAIGESPAMIMKHYFIPFFGFDAAEVG